MAISRSHLILLLFLSFLWLPTLLAIPFTDCGDDSYPVEVTSVDMIQDKIKASFQISGSTSKSISRGGYIDVNVKLGLMTILKKTYDPCESLTCPVAPGAFVLPFDKIFPLDSRIKFKVYVMIFDTDDEKIMCLTFDFQTKSSAVVSV